MLVFDESIECSNNLTVLDKLNLTVGHESAGLSDSMSQPNTNPNLNLVIYAIKFQFCILTSSTDMGSSWDTRKMYLEIEYIGKKLRSLRGREGETIGQGVTVTVKLFNLQCLENAPVEVVIRLRN